MLIPWLLRLTVDMSLSSPCRVLQRTCERCWAFALQQSDGALVWDNGPDEELYMLAEIQELFPTGVTHTTCTSTGPADAWKQHGPAHALIATCWC